MKIEQVGNLLDDIRYGFTGSAIAERNGIGFIRVTDIDEYGHVNYSSVPGVEIEAKEAARYFLEPGDCIIARSGSVGKAHVYCGENNKNIFASYLIRLRLDKKRINPSYFNAFTKSPLYWNQIEKNKQGGVQQNINTDGLSRLEIPLPDLKTQQEIAHVLEQADKARQQRKAANALSNEFLQSSFLSLFGDPVKNEKGWEVKKLGELVESFKYGTNQKTTEYSTEGLPVLRIPNVIGSKIDYSELKYAILPNKEKEDTKLQRGDLLFVRSNGNPNYIGRCAVFNDELECCYASYLIRARIKKSAKVDSSFIQFVMSFKTYRPLVLKKAKTTAGNYNINTESLKSFDIPIPPLSLQQQFAGIVAQAEQLRQKQRESERELENLFQVLLQKYFGAEVTPEQNEETQLSLAAEPEQPYGKVISMIPPDKKGFAKYVVAGKIIKMCRTKKEFTHIKFQKLQHLAEYLLEEDLKQNFYYQIAGPHDNKLMHNLATKMQQQKWFIEKNYKFIALEKVDELDKHFNKYFDNKKRTFDKLINLLGNAKESQCEIVSTLFAVWNDMLIQQISVTEEEIINRFYQWSDRKKNYKEIQLKNALSWMKENKLEPMGFGPLIKHKKQYTNQRERM